MANEDKKDFNAMLHDKKDMPKIQIITDQKSIEKYGGSKMYFAPPIDYDKVMKKIPYGKTITYGDIASNIAKKKKIKQMSSQAVGGAVGRNPICIIIPCHRVMGANNKLTGFGGGLNNKINLLKKEGYNFQKLHQYSLEKNLNFAKNI